MTPRSALLALLAAAAVAIEGCNSRSAGPTDTAQTHGGLRRFSTEQPPLGGDKAPSAHLVDG